MRGLSVIPNQNIQLGTRGGMQTNKRSDVYGAYVLSLAPLTYYRLDETSGIVVKDSSGNGYDAASSIIVNGPLGVSKNCYTFNGTTSYLNLVTSGLQSALNGNEFSFSLWLRTPTIYPWSDGAQHYLLRMDSSTGRAFAFLKTATNNQILANWFSAPTNAVKAITVTPSTSWMHIAVTVSNSNNRMRVYINGTLQAPATALGTAWTGTLTSLLIGSQGPAPSTVWMGYFDEAAFWNRELTQTEVTGLATATPNTGGVTSFLPYGDSKTAGQADSQTPYIDGSNGYPRQLAALTGLQEIPRIAVSSRTVALAQAAIDAELAAYIFTPNYILCNLGSNDSLALPVEATWKANYKYILQAMHTKWSTAQIYIMRAWRQGVDAACNSMATWISDLVVDVDLSGYCHLGPDERIFLKGSDDGATYTADGVHPNAAGQTLTAAQWKTNLGL